MLADTLTGKRFLRSKMKFRFGILVLCFLALAACNRSENHILPTETLPNVAGPRESESMAVDQYKIVITEPSNGSQIQLHKPLTCSGELFYPKGTLPGPVVVSHELFYRGQPAIMNDTVIHPDKNRSGKIRFSVVLDGDKLAKSPGKYAISVTHAGIQNWNVEPRQSLKSKSVRRDSPPATSTVVYQVVR